MLIANGGFRVVHNSFAHVMLGFHSEFNFISDNESQQASWWWGRRGGAAAVEGDAGGPRKEVCFY